MGPGNIFFAGPIVQAGISKIIVRTGILSIVSAAWTQTLWPNNLISGGGILNIILSYISKKI